MWQIWVAAAVAGSGFFVKQLHLFDHRESSDQKFDHHECDCTEPNEISSNPQLPFSDFSLQNGQTAEPCEESGVFRFSSAPGSPRRGNGHAARNSGKKLGFGSPGIRGMAGNETSEKKNYEVKDGGEGLLVDHHHKRIGKRHAVCLKKKKKKRRTCKFGNAKCESNVPKDDSSFALGLGFGLMCLMSVGKSEIGRLNSAVDETAKVVEELRTEIARRKFSQNDVLNLRLEGNADPKKSRGTHPQLLTSGRSISDEGESRSSVLTEELQPEVHLNQLEVELEYELRKLPWCTTKASDFERDFSENGFPAKRIGELDNQNSKPYQPVGVMPSALDQRLCHLLIEQQESKIMELKPEVNQSSCELCKKEAELQALKDCATSLTRFPLGSASDEETEAQENEEENGNEANNSMARESKKAVVGIKTAMDDVSYLCSCTK